MALQYRRILFILTEPGTKDGDRWQKRYENGETPWETGKPDATLIRMITSGAIPACNALEIGCGTGRSAIRLVQEGFSVTAVDISETAIVKARENAVEQNVDCAFLTVDFMTQAIPGAPFEFVFDRGCFHTYDSDDERRTFAAKVASYLKSGGLSGGLWLSFLGNADDPPRDIGPPRRSARDIVVAVEADFEILSLESAHFDSIRAVPPRSWTCLMRKRFA